MEKIGDKAHLNNFLILEDNNYLFSLKILNLSISSKMEKI